MLSERAAKFVHFSTREVVFPVIRRSFLFLMLILVLIGFFQGQGVSQKNGLVTPYLVRSVTRPLLLVAERQFAGEIQSDLRAKLEWQLSDSMAPQIAKAINERLLIYLPLLPFVFGLVVLAFVSPLITLSELLLLPVIRLIIRALLKLGVIKIAQETVARETLKL